HEVLTLINSRVQTPVLKLIIDATAAALAVHENKISEGIAAAIPSLILFSCTASAAAEYANFSSVGQFLAWAIAKIMAGVVATARGDFLDVVSSIEQ
ncbi:hypothetical protein C6A85_69410, partial [Mycobacterium sp. ITM-2017-0098]